MAVEEKLRTELRQALLYYSSRELTNITQWLAELLQNFHGPVKMLEMEGTCSKGAV